MIPTQGVALGCLQSQTFGLSKKPHSPEGLKLQTTQSYGRIQENMKAES